MSQPQPSTGPVTDMIVDLLPTVNEGFNWDVITERFDKDPVGTAMSLHFTTETGDEPEEELLLAITDGPEIEVVEEVTDAHDYIGALVMYQHIGLRILDADDRMDPVRARYQANAVTIHPGEGKSRERTWLVVSNVLQIILNTVIHTQDNSSAQGARTSSARAEGGRDE